MKEIELFAGRVKKKGLEGWTGSGVQRLGTVGDGNLLRLYVNAKTKAEELEQLHKEFLEYIEDKK